MKIFMKVGVTIMALKSTFKRFVTLIKVFLFSEQNKMTANFDYSQTVIPHFI